MDNITIKSIKLSMPPHKKFTDKIDIWVQIFARPLSYYITWILLKLNITATSTSFIALFVGSLGAILLVNTSFTLNLIGALLINLWIVFDCADGNVARFTKTSSKFGELMDAISGYIFISVLYLCIGSSAYLNGGIFGGNEIGWVFILLGGVASIASILPRLIEHKTTTLIENYKSTVTNKESYSILHILVLNIGGMAGLSVPLLVFAYLFSFVDLYIVFYALFHLAICIYSILQTINKAKNVYNINFEK